MTTTDSTSTHPVAQRLRQAGITRVVVIDDAFNTPVLDDLGDEIEYFWAEIVREESALTELRGLKEGFESEDDIDEELISVLWARTVNEVQSSLLLPCKSILFSQQLENLADLEPLVDYLKKIDITPILRGTEDDLPDGQQRLFFLDFILTPDIALPSSEEVETAIQEFATGTPADPFIQESIDKAKQILDEFDDAFIILMSSKTGVPQAKGRFRQETGLIEGMFDYIPKEQLAEERELSLKLGLSAASLPDRHDIQRFVDAFKASFTEASTDFINRIKSLSFEDYMYIYSFSLREEGQPLGDYMSWLYKSLLAHLVHNNEQVMEAQDKLNKIDIEAYVPLKRVPSKQLVKMYSLAQTEPGTSSNETQLRLGDLYVNGTKDVLLVINADCDLARLPPISDNQGPNAPSILLHPGRLEPIEKPIRKEVKENYKITNLFFLEGKRYRIVWDYEGIITQKFGDVKGWLDRNGYWRKERLITPHALQIQQHFAAKLTRVGMPVATPFPTPATVQVFGKNEGGTLKQLGADIPEGVVIDRNCFRFTVEGFRQLMERVDRGIVHYTAIRDSGDVNETRRNRVGNNIGKLEAWLQDCDEWFSLIESSHILPSGGGRPIGSNGVLEVFCRPNLESAQSIISINLILMNETL